MNPRLDDGVLPEGIHNSTLDEIEQMFGRFQRSDRRIRLMEKLKAYMVEARSVSFIDSIIIDGSFVTAKDEPGDIDLIVVLRTDHDLTRELRPFEYNVITKNGARRQGWPFDLFATPLDSIAYERTVELFSQVDPERHSAFTSRIRKGMLRVKL